MTDLGRGNAGAWVETWLSEPRFARYLAEAVGDRERALELYEWNLRLGAAVMRDIAHIEVAVRNVYDRTMREHWVGSEHWLFDPDSPVLVPLLRSRRGQQADMNARNRCPVAMWQVVREVGASDR